MVISIAFISIPVTGQSMLERMAKHAEQKAKKEAEKRAEKKANEKVDKEIEKSFDNLEKKFTKEQKSEQKQDHKQEVKNNNQGTSGDDDPSKALNNLMSQMGVSSTPVPIDNNYSFNSSVTMNFKSYGSNGKLENDGNMVSYFNSTQKNIAYEFIDGNIKTSQKDKTGTFIIDYINKATIILSDENGEKTGLVYGLGSMVNEADWDKAMEDDPQFKNKDKNNEIANPYFKKTGNSKSILGYHCEEFKYEDEEISSTYWITKDVNWNNRKLMSNIFAASIYSYGSPNGFLMESKSLDKNSGEKSEYSVTDINKSANKTFDVSQYQMTNIGSMKIPQQTE